MSHPRFKSNIESWDFSGTLCVRGGEKGVNLLLTVQPTKPLPRHVTQDVTRGGGVSGGDGDFLRVWGQFPPPPPPPLPWHHYSLLELETSRIEHIAWQIETVWMRAVKVFFCPQKTPGKVKSIIEAQPTSLQTQPIWVSLMTSQFYVFLFLFITKFGDNVSA